MFNQNTLPSEIVLCMLSRDNVITGSVRNSTLNKCNNFIYQNGFPDWERGFMRNEA
jgi:hypothetical protein